jgi:hypothetical protein
LVGKEGECNAMTFTFLRNWGGEAKENAYVAEQEVCQDTGSTPRLSLP